MCYVFLLYFSIFARGCCLLANFSQNSSEGFLADLDRCTPVNMARAAGCVLGIFETSWSCRSCTARRVMDAIPDRLTARPGRPHRRTRLIFPSRREKRNAKNGGVSREGEACKVAGRARGPPIIAIVGAIVGLIWPNKYEYYYLVLYSTSNCSTSYFTIVLIFILSIFF